MPDRLPPLSALRAFEAVVRLGSVNRAADELGRTHGAVSKQLKTLQDHAGLALLEKAGTGLKPTPAGRDLAAAAGRAFAAIGEAYASVTGDARSPGVTVACSATFAMSWLVPHLPEFSARHPEVRIRLSMTSARDMREEREADLIVLWDRSAYAPEDQARAIRLADTAFGLVAAPGYPVERGEDGALSAPCRIVHDHTSRAWDQWEAASGLRFTAAATISFPHTHLCLGAAVAGLGVAVAERRLAERALADLALETVSPFTPFPDGFVALPHRQRPLSASARLFVDWLSDALRA